MFVARIQKSPLLPQKIDITFGLPELFEVSVKDVSLELSLDEPNSKRLIRSNNKLLIHRRKKNNK